MSPAMQTAKQKAQLLKTAGKLLAVKADLGKVQNGETTDVSGVILSTQEELSKLASAITAHALA